MWAPVEHTSFARLLETRGFAPIRRDRTTTLQVNVGKVCNQACHHCHVDAGPRRTERMSADDVEWLLKLIAASPDIATVDVTGGAPELHPSFRRLVAGARALDREVIDRCNLTVIFEPGMEELPEFFASNRVRLVCSLPCYTADNVDAQRGNGVFEKSIRALRALNALGYGMPGSGLTLDLVYNPLGPALPPPQPALEARYKLELRERFDIVFDSLITITNMPIQRFADQLRRRGELAGYEQLLVESFNSATLDGLMCRTLVSVGYDGVLYDCDFNQMLEISLDGNSRPLTIRDIASFGDIDSRAVKTASHCFGCTAGAGSSCSGAIASTAGALPWGSRG
jgi:radical SAM/Cys-rich protein